MELTGHLSLESFNSIHESYQITMFQLYKWVRIDKRLKIRELVHYTFDVQNTDLHGLR